MTTSTLLLSPIEKEKNIVRLRELISRADDITCTFESIEDDLNSIDIWAHVVGDKIVYVITATVVGEGYFIQKVSGEGKLFPWNNFFDVVVPYAQSKDCSEILFSGDSSWEKKLKHLGFGISEYIYTVKV